MIIVIIIGVVGSICGRPRRQLFTCIVVIVAVATLCDHVRHGRRSQIPRLGVSRRVRIVIIFHSSGGLNQVVSGLW